MKREKRESEEVREGHNWAHSLPDLYSRHTCLTNAQLSDFVSQLEAAFKSYEEAPYELTKAGPGYEERLYAPTKWVCKTETDNPHVGNDLSLLFWPLFNYISGQNAREEKITMTAPVATKFMVRSSTDKTYEMCFYLGSTHQQNPPQPFPASGVVIQSRPEMRVVTRTVGGYIYHEEGWMEEAGRLAGILQEGGITVNLSQMYCVAKPATHLSRGQSAARNSDPGSQSQDERDGYQGSDNRGVGNTAPARTRQCCQHNLKQGHGLPGRARARIKPALACCPTTATAASVTASRLFRCSECG
ncbi:Heme-binding protein 2 [Chionoecetes opilio]|uniref:Heme-binding protein 2 n=1 Tax=Chionoecetes opilio TaxID=41210 RepID=A0A8J5CRT9_CHIOP|nr:Heme-binding protein 2 [Chionoecetes opilio]